MAGNRGNDIHGGHLHLLLGPDRHPPGRAAGHHRQGPSLGKCGASAPSGRGCQPVPGGSLHRAGSLPLSPVQTAGGNHPRADGGHDSPDRRGRPLLCAHGGNRHPGNRPGRDRSGLGHGGHPDADRPKGAVAGGQAGDHLRPDRHLRLPDQLFGDGGDRGRRRPGRRRIPLRLPVLQRPDAVRLRPVARPLRAAGRSGAATGWRDASTNDKPDPSTDLSGKGGIRS